MASGLLEGIYVGDRKGEPLTAVPTASAVAGVGLEGDRYSLGKGHWSGRGSDPVTLLEAEVAEALAGRDRAVEAADLRRNLVVRGIRLASLVGSHFGIGEQVVLHGTRPCEPCRYLESLTGAPGLKESLVGKGGLRAEVIRGGVLRVGDPIVVLGP